MAERMEDIWLRQARDGDQDAFGCLVRAYEKRVFALTRRLCADPSDAEDAARMPFSPSGRACRISGGRPASPPGSTG